MSIIDECAPEESREREQWWIDHYKNSGHVLTNSVKALGSGASLRQSKPLANERIIAGGLTVIPSRDFQKRAGEYIGAAISGEPLIVARHDRPIAVIVSYSHWMQLTFDDLRWRTILDKMSVKYPGKSDHELMESLLLQWQYEQETGAGKSTTSEEIHGLLTRILNVLLWVARKLGYEKE
jgi:prevent-host-death family protein